jgi:hypothetical protein
VSKPYQRHGAFVASSTASCRASSLRNEFTESRCPDSCRAAILDFLSCRRGVRMRMALNALERVIAVVIGCGFLFALALNFSNVVGRYVFHAPIFWAEEAMIYTFVWCVFLGAVFVALRGKIRSGRIRAVRQNQRIIGHDARDPPGAWNDHRQSVQVAAPA